MKCARRTFRESNCTVTCVGSILRIAHFECQRTWPRTVPLRGTGATKSIQPPYTREKIRDALAQLNYDGAGVIVHYSQRNDPSPDTIVLTQISGGKFILAK